MDVDFYDVFASEGAVPGVDESESDIFDASGMFCAELPSSETSLSLQSSTASETSTTTSSSEVRATAVGLVASAESASSDPGMLVRQFGKQEDAAASVPEMLEVNGDGGFSNDSNGSSVVTMVEGGVSVKTARTDVTREIIDLDGSRSGQSSQKNRSIAPSCRWGSIADESSFFQLDDLLQLDSREPLVDSGIPLADNFFTPSLGQPSTASVGDWPAELLPDFSCSLGASQPMPEVYEEPVENVSQVFARWLQSNSHRFSLSDISKIKLKTSTIENGMKRLGGGKKGMLYFLKLVLSWIQDQHGNRRCTEITGPVGLDNSTGVDKGRIPAKVENGSINGSSCVLAAVSAAGRHEKVEEDLYRSAFRRKDERFDLSEPAATQPKHEGTCAVDGGGSVYNNYYPHSTAPLQLLNEENCGWSRTMNDGGEIPLYSASNGTPRSLSPSSLSQVTNVGNCESQWHDNTAAGSPLQDRACLQPRVISSNFERYSSFSNSLDVKSPNTSAATTRAARMSRMERRKWSAQRQRKWPGVTASKMSWSSQSVTRGRPVL